MVPIKSYWMSFAALFVFFIAGANGSVITLSAPAYPTPVAEDSQTGMTMLMDVQLDYSVSASPLPTPAVNGMTKYEEVKYYTRIVAVYNKTTSVTLLSTPTPVHTYTAEHGASSRLASGGEGATLTFEQKPDQAPIPDEIWSPAFIENCTMSTEEKKGVCVRRLIFNGTGSVPENSAIPPNITWTITGPLEAYATATIGAGFSLVAQPGSGMIGVGLLVCSAIAISAGLLL